MIEKQKILIVDDKKENLVVLRQVLKGLDAEIVEARSGNEALAATLDHCFAVAILDVMMPGMSGYELAEHLSGDDKTKVIPIVFLTASYADEQHMFEGYAAGGIDYIIKPYAPEVLLGKVKVLLELDRHRHELQRHRDHLENLVAERTEEMRKRIKEIECLYAVSSFVAKPCRSIDEALKTAADLIPPGWQHSEIARARIVFEGRKFASEGFMETPWKQSADIVLSGETVGTVEVCYLEERPARDEGPFILEERSLINELARQLGIMIQRERAHARLEHVNRVLASIRDVNRLIVREKQRKALLHAVCHSLTRSRGLHGAWIVLTDGLPDRVEGAQAGFKEAAFSELLNLVQWGETPACFRDSQTEPGVNMMEIPSAACGNCPLGNTCGGNGAIAIELTHADRRYGYMGVSVPTQFRIDKEEASLFEEIAGDIAFALASIEQEEALRISERRYRMLTENLPQKIFVKDRQSVYISCNENYARDLGILPDEITGKTDYDFYSKELAAKYRTDDERLMEQGKTEEFEEQYVQHGKEAWIHMSKTPIRNDEGNITGILGIFWDVTEKRQLEEQFRQVQKLEAVGVLAGGVAHDFNNILSVIIGYGEELLHELHTTDPLRESAEEIVEAGKRSAALTRQLLAFSRKQTLQPEVLHLNDIVKNLEKMMRRLIGEDIELTTLQAEGLASVEADPGQIEQVIMNLAVNARDAMPQGGKLTIETANVELDESYANNHVSVVPGRYVMLAITDTGCGMDEATVKKIFEPFFTTKEKGKGTGLGLSTVYGIVKQSEGNIWVYSEPGKGTTFKIYLPQTQAERATKEVSIDQGDIRFGEVTILAVEDDPALRKLIERMLERLQCPVNTAANGGEALLMVEEKGLRPDLLITDMVMPGMNGKALADRLRITQPDLKVLYMSGYTDNSIVHRGVLDPGTPFIQKPFSFRDLTSRIESLLRTEHYCKDKKDHPDDR
ncbi:MAG: response regulator [Desulfobacterales bacterium]